MTVSNESACHLFTHKFVPLYLPRRDCLLATSTCGTYQPNNGKAGDRKAPFGSHRQGRTTL